MKKILVVLLILAVAGGVFAQEGSWSIGGKAEIGTRIDFDPIPGVKAEDEVALIRSIGYNPWGNTHGEATLSYNNEGLNIGLTWNTHGGDGGPALSYNGDNYKFVAETNLSQLIDTGSVDIGRLWGEYLFLNGLISLEAAYNSRDNGDGTWTSDKSGVFSSLWATYGPQSPAGGIRTNFFHNDVFGDGDTFAAFDHPSLLMANVNLDAISFGVQVRNFFDRDGQGIQGWAEYGSNNATTKLIDDVIKSSVIGLKFNMSPLEVAAQFRLKQAGVYFGGKFFAGPLTVGLSFNGLFQGSERDDGTYDNDKRMKFGGDVAFNGGLFDAGIKAYYDRRNDAVVVGDYSTTIGVLPRFSYNAIPTHLRFEVNTGFYFINNLAGGVEESSEFIWAVQPQLLWNFRGTGAGGYYGGLDTGILIRYRMASAFDPNIAMKAEGYYGGLTSDAANFLDLVFRWNFF